MDMKNYTLGRGKFYFSRFIPNTQTPSGFVYFGNTPEFNLTIEAEMLDHFSSDEGIREKDDSIPLQVNRTGTLTTDNIAVRNIALFYFGNDSIVTTAAAAGLTETLESVKLGYSYRLGQSPSNPTGYFGISTVGFTVQSSGGGAAVAADGEITFSGVGTDGDTITIGGLVYTLRAAPTVARDVDIGGTATATADNLVAAITAGAGAGTAYGTGTTAHPDVTASAAAGVVTVTALTPGTTGNSIALAEAGSNTSVSGATLTGGSGTALVAGVDFTLEADIGLLTILETGAVSEGDDLDVTYSVRASTRERVISGSAPVEGAVLYKAQNPKGKNFHYYMPRVLLSPNGDYALKGDEWQMIPYTLDIQKAAGFEAIYVDGNPAFA